MPAIISSLVVIPIILIARLYNQTLWGFFAALLGSIAWSYYNRTMAGYYDTDMFSAIEENREAQETFYDGYVVNAILDAAYRSAETQLWEAVIFEDWRGDEPESSKKEFASYNEDYYLIKEEVLPNGDSKLILKHKVSGKVVQKTKT